MAGTVFISAYSYCEIRVMVDAIDKRSTGQLKFHLTTALSKIYFKRRSFHKCFNPISQSIRIMTVETRIHIYVYIQTLKYACY